MNDAKYLRWRIVNDATKESRTELCPLNQKPTLRVGERLDGAIGGTTHRDGKPLSDQVRAASANKSFAKLFGITD